LRCRFGLELADAEEIGVLRHGAQCVDIAIEAWPVEPRRRRRPEGSGRLDVERLDPAAGSRRADASSHGIALLGDHRAVRGVEPDVATVVECDPAKALFTAKRGDTALEEAVHGRRGGIARGRSRPAVFYVAKSREVPIGPEQDAEVGDAAEICELLPERQVLLPGEGPGHRVVDEMVIGFPMKEVEAMQLRDHVWQCPSRIRSQGQVVRSCWLSRYTDLANEGEQVIAR
jgi:hypothetical protein